MHPHIQTLLTCIDLEEKEQANRYKLDQTHTLRQLKAEGLAREVVNRIQNMRKDSGFEVTDRISVQIQTTDIITEAIKQFEQYICAEVLANNIQFTSLTEGQQEAIEAEGDTVFNITKSN